MSAVAITIAISTIAVRYVVPHAALPSSGG
jgi:hypothetical protein